MKNIKILIVVIITFSASSIFAQKKLDRTKLPADKPAPIIKIGKADNFTLANGLKVYVVKNTKLPRVAFNLVIDRDPILEGNMAGLTSAVGDLLSTGTKNRTKDQYDEETDFIGANITTSSTGIYAVSLKKHTEKLLDLMSDVLLNPNFTEIELDKLKKQMKSNLASNKDDPNAIAARVSQVILFGKDHPYGEQMTTETVENITLEACNKYYNTYFKPNIGYLAVVGDITVEEAKKLVDKHFGSWQSANVPRKITASSRLTEKTKVIFVDRPNAVQSVINIVNTADLRIGSPDVLKARITNDILGGSEARLHNNLREKHGYTYGAFSRLTSDRIIGKFSASASVRNAVTDSSITEFMTELNAIKNSSPTADELNRTKNDITGDFVFSLENPQTIANFALNTARYNLPGDYYSNYLKNVEATTSEEVQNIAQKYIKPDNCYIIVVGKASEIADKLKKFGEIEYYDVEGNKVLPPAPPKPVEKGITVETILEKYIAAIGGKDKVSAVTDLVMNMTGNIPNGPAIVTLITKKAPNKSIQEVKVMGNTMQKVVVDGTNATSSLRGQETVLKDAELQQALAKASIFYELDPKKAGLKAALAGTEKLNGKDCTKIEYSIGDAKWTEYYENTSGLKLRTTETRKTPNGEVQTIVDYAAYKETDGVKFPGSIKQNMGQMHIDLTLESVKVNKGVEDKVFTVK